MRGLGGVFIAYALIGYPVIGLLGGHPLRDLPVFGLAPCASVTFFFGLLVPLARALTAVPPDMATGVAADYGMLVAALIATGLIIWRDRAWTPTWETVAAGLLLALMIAWSGHDNILIGLAVVLVAAALVEAITGRLRQPQERTTRPCSAAHCAQCMNTACAAAPTRSGARSQRLVRQGAERTHAGTAIDTCRVIGHLGSYG